MSAAWRGRYETATHVPGVWHFTARLSCGHELDFGTVATDECRTLVRYRQDASFGAITCPAGCGRRRVRSTSSASVVLSRAAVDVISRAALTTEDAKRPTKESEQ